MSNLWKLKTIAPFVALSLVAAGLAIAATIAHYSRNSAHPVAIPVSEFSLKGSGVQNLENQWVVGADRADELLAAGATLIDARPRRSQRLRPVPGAIPVSWKEFSQPKQPWRGKLLEDDLLLTEKLQAIGVFQEVPVLVFGDTAKGWGEEGRIVWMLRSLGHKKAVIIDGGDRVGRASRLTAIAPIQATNKATSPPKRGDFLVKRVGNWQIGREELRASLAKNNLVIIDAREKREYFGKTPYGESRGGRIPGAIHLYYKELLAKNGLLLSREEIVAKLEQKGITPTTEIAIYCTGGVRSAWLTSVLADLGYKAKNYPGSMWEWSAGSPLSYPLEKGKV
ncbi:MAG: sulfurtransferase [Oscillatoria sp. SIO1A7]|nr:sulfurtransferase [Oscillatoria sp. SIO1A7]